MKIIITLLFLLNSLVLLSQGSNTIVNESGLWSTVESHCMPNGTNYSTYYIKFQGDTLIDGLEYIAIWRSNEEAQENWDLYGFIRENANNEVFLKPPFYVEGLIYDFTVNQGDSIEAVNLYLNDDTLHFIVSQVDSIFLYNEFRKRIFLEEYMNNKEEVWIEGVGSLFGILNSCNDSYGSLCGGYENLCYEEDGELIFQNPNYLTCYYDVTVGVPKDEIESLKVYPNPANDYVEVAINDSKGVEIELINLQGKKILKKVAIEGKNILYLHEVDNGIYFINVINTGRYYPPYKLIVD